MTENPYERLSAPGDGERNLAFYRGSAGGPSRCRRIRKLAAFVLSISERGRVGTPGPVR